MGRGGSSTAGGGDSGGEAAQSRRPYTPRHPRGSRFHRPPAGQLCSGRSGHSAEELPGGDMRGGAAVLPSTASSGGEEAMAASDSDDCAVQPDLSYLLEASDDELGLPPTIVPTSSSDEGEATAEGDLGEEVKPEAALFAPQIWGFDDEIPCYCDPLDLGLGQEDDENAAAAAAAGGALLDGGLFDYADVGPFGPSDFLDYSWRPESLPAV
ncbi:unnamed protein product [Spirodela intermedia]|uniref:Uncharacterized protein n=1 Tax=Spirodela intermedia TaxID=51605 RepID=A0A7I8J6P2_SPIIN|nr:unnamed protein product [Spirodela intermedia]CAA6665395.1 unnamed protein product [Spirodela intermedia]